jgi:hypothetical protein
VRPPTGRLRVAQIAASFTTGEIAVLTVIGRYADPDVEIRL